MKSENKSRIHNRPLGLTRREFAALGGGALLAAFGKDLDLLVPRSRAAGVPASMVGTPRTVPISVPSVVLNPADISSFTVIGNQQPTVGGAVIFNDASQTDVSGLSATDADAATGVELDLTAKFQVSPQTTDGVDAGFQLTISDGTANRAAIAACIVVNGVPHIGLVSTGARDALTTYPAFIAAEWQAAPLTLKLRRTAEGGVQLLELNGAPPATRTELLPQQAAPRTRPGNLAEFGCFSGPATLTAQVDSFMTERPAQPTQGNLTFTRFRIRDTDSTDRLAFRADFQLGTGTNGINPAAETVAVKLSTAQGEFYAQTLNGFNVRGQTPRRRWVLNDAERARTGIEQMVIEEDPNNSGSIFLRDVRNECGTREFTNVTVEVIIGAGAAAEVLTGSAELVEVPAGSGRWRFHREP